MRPAAPPSTKKQPVKDIYHGVTVTDDYRWLEDWNNKDVKAWSDAQNAYARGVLDKLPGVDVLRKRADQDPGRQDDQPRRLLLPRRPALRHPPAAAQAAAVPRRHAGARSARQGPRPPRSQRPRHEGHHCHRLVRPLARRQARGRIPVEGRQRSPAMFTSTTRRPARRSTRSFRASTAARPAATWPGRRTARASSTRAIRAAQERPAEDLDFYQQLYFHELGTPTDKDRYELGKDLPRIAEIKLDARRHGPTAGHGAERRRRRVRPLPARCGRQMAAVQHVQRQAGAGRLRPA